MVAQYKKILVIALFLAISWFIGFIFFNNYIFSQSMEANHNQTKENTNTIHNNYIESMFKEDESNFVPFKVYDANKEFDVRLIALYLPQYHQFKENNEWHGRGFTEWSNVAKAKPLFAGHYQPKLPIDVGFYDLSHPDIMYRQIELAKNYGISGFAFYYYWFSGKKLMEKPVYNYLNDKNLDFPFCIHWANESWSKKWDGGDNELLMKQDFSRKDFESFSKDLFEFFKDPRYIKINNRPLFIVYRPAIFDKELFVDFTKYLKEYTKSRGMPEPYIIATKQFAFFAEPKEWGLDAVMDFELNTIPNLIHKKINKINEKHEFNIYAWGEYIYKEKMQRKYTYKTFRTVFPRWDNSARKAYSGSLIFADSTPDVYGRWLNYAINETSKELSPDEQIVFINAWNEWGEGAMLEPDIKYGYAYLDTTRKVLEKTFIPNKNPYQKSGVAVLTGGRNRIAHAISLLNQGIGEHLLISGVKVGNNMKILEARDDVKIESIMPVELGYKAKDTKGNADEIKQWALKHKIEKIYVVSSFYHIPRVRLEVENVIKDKEIEYISTPSEAVSDKWWKNINSFKFLSMEYTKFLIVFVQYKVLGL